MMAGNLSPSDDFSQVEAVIDSFESTPPGFEFYMRFISIVRVVCDELSRDLIKHVLVEIHSNDWDTFIHEPEYEEEFKKCFKRHKTPFSATSPALEECDTTLLSDIFENFATVYPADVGAGRNKTYDDDIKAIRKFRNETAHFTNVKLTESEYEQKIDHFLSSISQFDANTFENLDWSMQFVERNRRQTFEDFCRYNPREIAFQYSRFSDQQRAILERVDCFMAIVESHKNDLDDRIDHIEGLASNTMSRIEVLEGIVRTESVPKLPNSNLIKIRNLEGRDQDLDKLADCFENSQLVSIVGPAGVGKTSLALTYANMHNEQEEREETDPNGGMRHKPFVHLYVKMIEVTTHENETDKELKQKMARKIGSLFPAIAMALTETDDAFGLLLLHAREVVNHRRLFFILDNVDTVLNAQLGNVLGNVLEELMSLDCDVQILTTSRDKRLYCEQLPLKFVCLKPISNEHCLQWLKAENQEANLSDELICAISESCGGIPLILRIMHSVAMRRPELLKEELLSSMKKEDEWSRRLTISLNLSFELLTSGQSNLIKCASVFSSYFEKETLLQMFEELNQRNESGLEALNTCSDLSLTECEASLSMIYLHPYIQEHIQDNVIASEAESRYFNAIFVVTYFQKLLNIADEQMNKDAFVNVLNKVALDSYNIEKFIRLVSTQNQPQAKIFKKFTPNDKSLRECVLLINFLWLLNKMGRYKNKLPVLAVKLEKIFHNAKMKAHEILVKCFLSHKLRLLIGLGNLSKSRSKIDEARKMTDLLPLSIKQFCDGHIQYAMGRFNQQSRAIRYWRKESDWENIAAEEHFSSAAENFSMSSTDMKTSHPYSLKTAQKVEWCRVQLLLYSEILDGLDDEKEKDICFEELESIVSELTEILGNHEVVAFAIKKYADHLKHNGRKNEASVLYEKAYEMYSLYGAEILTQQIVVLKDWSDCDEDRREALTKLQIAEAILEQHYMQKHSLHKKIQDRIKDCLQAQ